MRKGATSEAKARGKEKRLFKCWMNFSHELHVLYVAAYSERQAWMNACRRIAKKHDVSLGMVLGHFDGKTDNYVIKEEQQAEEDCRRYGR